jgi:hypothetical protein
VRAILGEEFIQGLLFPAYRRASTAIFVPAPSGSDPLDLEAAKEQDAAMPNSELATAQKF